MATAAALLAPTPYMGWDSYFTFGGYFDEGSVLAQASQLLTKGLAKEGYDYVWLDVGWWQGTRDAAGNPTVNPAQWPHGMAWLARTLHGIEADFCKKLAQACETSAANTVAAAPAIELIHPGVLRYLREIGVAK